MVSGITLCAQECKWTDYFGEPPKSLDHPGNAVRSPAARMALPDDAAHAIVTDPPYYGSILYSDLADYFYV
jgi:adenine-specific DNA methylase